MGLLDFLLGFTLDGEGCIYYLGFVTWGMDYRRWIFKSIQEKEMWFTFIFISLDLEINSDFGEKGFFLRVPIQVARTKCFEKARSSSYFSLVACLFFFTSPVFSCIIILRFCLCIIPRTELSPALSLISQVKVSSTKVLLVDFDFVEPDTPQKIYKSHGWPTQLSSKITNPEPSQRKQMQHWSFSRLPTSFPLLIISFGHTKFVLWSGGSWYREFDWPAWSIHEGRQPLPKVSNWMLFLGYTMRCECFGVVWIVIMGVLREPERDECRRQWETCKAQWYSFVYLLYCYYRSEKGTYSRCIRRHIQNSVL
jgi:hypothetical protein